MRRVRFITGCCVATFISSNVFFFIEIYRVFYLKIKCDGIFQVAHHKAYNKFVSTYESCSTAGFKHGRTETMRPCTEATKEFAIKFNSNNRPSKNELLNMMKHCSEVHKTLTKEALMGIHSIWNSPVISHTICRRARVFLIYTPFLFLGQGFDRHLFGLKNISEESGSPLPDLFKDDAYKLINYNVLSTSTLADKAIKLGGFGPVVPDGFGIG